MPHVTIHHGDMFDILKLMPKESVDAVVTDPPYGLSFMSKEWDHEVPDARYWRRCWHRLKPGGHLVAFSSARTYHRLASAIEDAGFEIRDQLMWIYGQGMPKSLNVAKAIDKMRGAARPVLGTAADFAPDGRDRRDDGSHQPPHAGQGGHRYGDRWSAQVTASATDDAQRWDGWGTALKPAHEPIVLARKPLSEPTVAANVLRWGTGGLNIDGCRVPHVTIGDGNLALNPHLRTHINGGNGGHILSHEPNRRVVTPHQGGRWPANVVHDGSAEVEAAFPDAKGQQGDLVNHAEDRESPNGIYGRFAAARDSIKREDESTSAARFFNSCPADGNSFIYAPKATKADRAGSLHPTVKPVAVMRWLVRLVTPPGGVVLEPFAGSGTTGEAALAEGHDCVMVERDDAYASQLAARFAGRTTPVPESA